MKFKRVQIPLKSNIIYDNNFEILTPTDSDDTLIIDALIEELLEDGWEIVSTCPIVSSKEISPSKIFTYTSGIEVMFIKNINNELNNNVDTNFNIIPSNNLIIPLNSGRFQMPDNNLNKSQKINFYSYWNNLWSWDGTEENQTLDESGRAIRTYLISLGLINENNNSGRYVDNTFNSRKIYLESKINFALESIEEESYDSKIKLFDAFNAIQLWGGKMGKSFYIQNTNTTLEDKIQQGALIEEKWINSIDTIYRNAIKSIINNNYTISEIEESFNQIDGMGVAFATKHLNFWSSKSSVNVLPIYDSFIYKILFAKEKGNPNWKYYNKYVSALNNLKTELDNRFTITDLERALFAYGKIIGVKPNNIVDIIHQNDETIIVNSFINSRMLI